MWCTFPISAYGLMRLYANHHRVRVIIRLYLAWPCLPLEDMRPQLRHIWNMICLIDKPSIKQGFKRFHHRYFRAFWLKKVTPERLCVFGLQRRTTNDMESLHSKMGKRLRQHPVFLRFMKTLQKNIFHPANRAARAVLADADGHPTGPIRSKKIQARLE